MAVSFNYTTAFSRNIGWVTPHEQAVLRSKHVAIAGLGGVGGSHLLTLTRLGIGAFTITDFDTFELANFNRQAGSGMSSIGKAKSGVLADRARDINPDLELRILPQGLNGDNLTDFLDDVDLYVDGLDFFAVAIRRQVFAACAALGIPATTVAPLGMGAALLNFLPGRMSFEEYFQLEACSDEEQLLRFLLGLSPAMLQRRYLVEPSAVQLAAHRGPSTPMACELCAGIAATEALKLLLGRGGVIAAPRGLQFDAYRNRLVQTWRPGGNRNPVQRLGLMLARRQLKKLATMDTPAENHSEAETAVERILDLARWAPSGDNTQPWRFELIDENHVVIKGHDTRDWCVYDLDGRPSQIAVGALLETIAIAATDDGLRAEFVRQKDALETKLVIDVAFTKDADIQRDPLLDFITARTTQRRVLSSRALTDRQKHALEEAVAPGYRVLWLEGGRNKRRMARLLFRNAHIRLTIPEAYQVHRKIIQWNTRFSEDRIPDQALGIADPLTLHLMRWAMQRWERVVFLNRYFAGTLLPRLQLDVLPALRCAGHFVLIADNSPETIDDQLSAGRALQRFWLTATRLGLLLQPEMTPLIFSRYVRNGVVFTQQSKAWENTRRLSRELETLTGSEEIRHAVFMGRLGLGPAPVSRSTRLPLDQLLSR